ncbi:MAG: cupredoxin domain-containing protein [Actinomycetota bacterium]
MSKHRSSKWKLVAASSALALFVLGVPAEAQVQGRPGALALLQAKFYGYATPVIVVEPGEEVTFTNIDIEMHDLVQDVETDGVGAKKTMPWCKKKKGKKKRGHGGHSHGHACPIFWTPLISLGQTTPILGLENVRSGDSYTYFCTLHHSMTGTLIVR